MYTYSLKKKRNVKRYDPIVCINVYSTIVIVCKNWLIIRIWREYLSIIDQFLQFLYLLTITLMTIIEHALKLN